LTCSHWWRSRSHLPLGSSRLRSCTNSTYGNRCLLVMGRFSLGMVAVKRLPRIVNCAWCCRCRWLEVPVSRCKSR
jgi:hypothetical protein